MKNCIEHRWAALFLRALRGPRSIFLPAIAQGGGFAAQLMKRFILLSTVCLIFLAPACFGGGPLGSWTWRNPSTTGNTLKAVAFGSSAQFTNFVAVDNSGSIFSSPDGLNWSERFVGTNALTAVCFGNGNFVAVGGRASGGGVVVLSQDGGTNWSLDYSVTNFLNAVAFGNNEFVAIGNGGATCDANGIDWVSQNNPTVPAGINGIAWGDPPGDFVAVGNNGEVHYSADGVNWNDVTTSGTLYQLNSVAYGGGTVMNGSFGYFVAVGESVIITTTSASTLDGWHMDSTTDFGTAVTYGGNNMFVSVDIDHRPGTFVSTNNGYTFTQANSGSPPPYADGITYGNGYFVAVGDVGQTAVSMDASNWTLSASPATTQPLSCGAFRPSAPGNGGPLFVAGGGEFGGSGVILTSPNGTNWTLDTDPSVTGYKGVLGFTVPSGFVYVAPQFVGVGTTYNGFEDGVALISTNGTFWATNLVIANHSLNRPITRRPLAA